MLSKLLLLTLIIHYRPSNLCLSYSIYCPDFDDTALHFYPWVWIVTLIELMEALSTKRNILNLNALSADWSSCVQLSLNGLVGPKHFKGRCIFKAFLKNKKLVWSIICRRCTFYLFWRLFLFSVTHYVDILADGYWWLFVLLFVINCSDLLSVFLLCPGPLY